MAYIGINKDNAESFVGKKVVIKDGHSEKDGEIVKVFYSQYVTELKVVDENGEDHYAIGLYENAKNEVGFHLA